MIKGVITVDDNVALLASNDRSMGADFSVISHASLLIVVATSY